MMVAKEQNGHVTRSGMLACCISSSCIFLRARENNEEGRMSCRIDRGNWCSQEPGRNKYSQTCVKRPYKTIHILDGVSPSVFRCTSIPMETGPIVTCGET